MKAVFVVRGCLLRNASNGLTEEVAASMRQLAQSDLFVVLLGAGTEPKDAEAPQGEVVSDADLIEWVNKAGGRIDAITGCPHKPTEHCLCWGSHPGLLLETARDLDIHLDESYLVCDQPNDVLMGYAAGCRPLLVLAGRSIESLYGGYQPEPADFPVALDMARAADYVACEEEIAVSWGRPRPMATLALEDGESLLTWPDGIARDALPTVTAFSPVETKAPVQPVQVIRNSSRLFLLIVVSGVWVSLGIAYLLTHLYRVEPFPEFVWYLTLQFIPRPVRGLLFIVTGILMLLLAVRSVRKAVPTLRWGKPSNK